MIENAHPDDPDLTTEYDEGGDDTWQHPKALGICALVLAVLTMFGTQIFRGSAYTLPFAPDRGGDVPGSDYYTAGAFLTVLFAFVPVLLAKLGLARVVPDDGPWAEHVLRAAYVLGLVSLVLHLVQALLALQAGDNPTLRILY